MYKCALLCIFVSYVNAESVSVVTEVGTIVGQKEDGYNTFLGIPYAKVNESNPFGSSIVYPKFETSFVANDSSTICPQIIFQNSSTLQCLHLHLYVPHTAKSDQNIPIMVWFHGGGFAFGSGGEYGGKYLVKRGIIVVTVNYRLGPYGFLCLDDPSVPGNQGMKDQIEALRWVKNNIGAFGGDPSKVTIAGESYGGGAIDLHMYSEYEKLFDKGIVQSGSIFFKGFYVKPDPLAAVKMASHLGHNTTNNRNAIKALAESHPLAVMSAAATLSLPMSICKEKPFEGVKSFVRSDPFHLNKTDKLKNTTIMIGYTSMELIRNYGNKPNEFWDKMRNVFVDTLNKHFLFTQIEVAVLGNVIKNFYLGGKDIGNESVLELSEFSSDFIINHSAERSLKNYLKAELGGIIYKYLFSYIGGSPFKNIKGSGASHTEELKYLFEWTTPIAYERSPVTGAEQMLIRDRMTTMWANFVKYGNPTPNVTEELPVQWKPVSGTSRRYLNIDVNLSMRDHVYNQRMAFWDLVWHSYENRSVVFDGPPLYEKEEEVENGRLKEAKKLSMRGSSVTTHPKSVALVIVLHSIICLFLL